MGNPKQQATNAANLADNKLDQVADITRKLASLNAHRADVTPKLEHSAAISEFLDRATHAAMSKVTKGASPAALGEA
jgi:hypothetical protein